MKKFLSIKFVGSIFACICMILSIIFAAICFNYVLIFGGIYITLCALSFGYNSYTFFINWKNKVK